MNLLSSSLQYNTHTQIQLQQTFIPQQHHAKLHLLQENDADRNWQTIDDKRTCLLCGSEFTGEEIRIRVKNGKPVFECPGRLCRGTLRHFVYDGNPLLSEATWSDWMSVTTKRDVDA